MMKGKFWSIVILLVVASAIVVACCEVDDVISGQCDPFDSPVSAPTPVWGDDLEDLGVDTSGWW